MGGGGWPGSLRPLAVGGRGRIARLVLKAVQAQRNSTAEAGRQKQERERLEVQQQRMASPRRPTLGAAYEAFGRRRGIAPARMADRSISATWVPN